MDKMSVKNANLRDFIESLLSESMSSVRKANNCDYDKAKLVLSDLIMVAASGTILDDDARAFAKKMINEQRQATILGLWKKTSLLNSMMANAFSAHSLELDDWMPYGFFHASATIIPPLLAYGEIYSYTLEEVIDSVFFGYEVGARLGGFLGRQHFRYWHPTSTVGGVASASSLAYLASDGSLDEVEKAFTLSLGYSSGIWKVIMSDVYLKPFSTVHAVFLAYLSNESREVIKKPSSDFFSSDKTLCKLLNGECNYEKALNVPWRLAIEKTSIKLYPIARNIQTVVQACSKIKQNVKPNEIESVTVEVFEEAYQVADIENPQSIDEAKFSLKFVASLSFVDEVNGIRSISAGLRNPLVRELEKKIEVKTREDFSLLYPSKQPVRVIVKTKRGETIEVYEDEPIGDISSRNIEAIINKKAEMLSKDTGDLRLLAIPNAIKNIKLNESIGSVLEKLL